MYFLLFDPFTLNTSQQKKKKKKKLKSCWRSLVLHGMPGHNAAMLFSAWSKILDRAAVPVPITPSSKTLCWLVCHLTLSSYFCLQRQELTSLMEIIFYFICKDKHSNASLRVTGKSLFRLRDFASSGQSPTLSVFMCFTDSFSRNQGCCFRHLCVSKPQEGPGFGAPPGWRPRPQVTVLPSNVRWGTTCSCQHPASRTELFWNGAFIF